MAPPVSAPPPLANRPLYHAAPKPLSAGLDIPKKQLLLGRMAALSKNWTPEQRAKFLKVATESVATACARFSSWLIKTQVECACLCRDCLMTVVLLDNGVLVDPIPKRLIWSSKVLVEHAHLFLPSCVWTLFLFFLLVHDFFFQLEIRRRTTRIFVQEPFIAGSIHLSCAFQAIALTNKMDSWLGQYYLSMAASTTYLLDGSKNVRVYFSPS